MMLKVCRSQGLKNIYKTFITAYKIKLILILNLIFKDFPETWSLVLDLRSFLLKLDNGPWFLLPLPTGMWNTESRSVGELWLRSTAHCSTSGTTRSLVSVNGVYVIILMLCCCHGFILFFFCFCCCQHHQFYFSSFCLRNLGMFQRNVSKNISHTETHIWLIEIGIDW